GCVDLIADLLEHGGRALGGEDAGHRDLVFADAEAPGGVNRFEQRVFVLALHRLPESAEGLGRLDSRSRLIPYATCHDQRVARVLVEQLVGFDVQCVRLWIPHDLINAQNAWRLTRMTERAAEADHKASVAGG